MKTAPSGRIVFLDTEFTTLSKSHRQVWEIALIVRDPGEADQEYEWQIRPPMEHASPDSLRIGRYYARNRVADRPVGTALTVVDDEYPELLTQSPTYEGTRITTAAAVATRVARLVDGAYLVGAVPSADETALDVFLPQHGHVLTTFYRIRCVETLLQGYLLGRRAERCQNLGLPMSEDPHPLAVPPPPWDPQEMSRLAGVPVPGDEVAHRALVDARWVRDLWDAAHGQYPYAKHLEAQDGRA